MQQATSDKWLIIPLEIVERELEGNLLICEEAMSRGWGCIIGTDKEIYESIDLLPRGVFFSKSTLHHQIPQLRKMKNKGYNLLCLDAEGLIQNDLEYMVNMRCSDEGLNILDKFLVWGDVQKKAHEKKYPQHKLKFKVTGNPRIDLWGKKKYHSLYEQESQNIQSKYGEYIIIPTSFGVYNHFIGLNGQMEVLEAGRLFVSDEHREFLTGYTQYIKNIYEGFFEIVEPLSQKFPHVNIIIRPHPSENPKPWRAFAKNLDNVHVELSGGVTPWLLGAKAVLHCCSTTAVEAHLLGKTVISYCRGYNDPKYELKVPAKVSINVTKTEEVLTLLENVLNNENIVAKHPEIKEGHEWLKGWADNIEGNEAAPLIVDELESLNIESNKYSAKSLKKKIKLNSQVIKSYAWFLLHFLDYIPLLKNIMPFKIRFGIKAYKYGKYKTNNLKEIEVQSFLEKAMTINNRRAPYQMIKLKKNIVALSPSK